MNANSIGFSVPAMSGLKARNAAQPASTNRNRSSVASTNQRLALSQAASGRTPSASRRHPSRPNHQDVPATINSAATAPPRLLGSTCSVAPNHKR